MKTLILQNILSSNNVHSINSLMERYDLKKNNTEILFCSKTEKNRHWKLHEKPQFRFRILPSVSVIFQGKDLFTYFINLNILKVLVETDPDWIIIGGWDQFAYQIAIFWGKIMGKRVTLWSGSTKYEKSWRRAITKPLVRLLVICSSDFLAYGKRAKEYLVSLGARPNHITILLNGVNHSYFIRQSKKYSAKRKEIKNKLNISAPLNLLFVGQLIERKGILELLGAYERLFQINGKWGLIIVGKGYLEDEIKIKIKQGDLYKAKLFTHVEQYDLPTYYAASDCLVLPSKEEVWGLVVNEAMACSLPVIISNRAGCVDDLLIIRKNGYSFFPNEASLFEIIHRISLKSLSELRVMGNISLKLIIRKFHIY